MNENEKFIEDQLKDDKTYKILEKKHQEKKAERESDDGLSYTLKKMLLYVGFIGAIISALAYLIITIVMVAGVSADIALQNQILFSILGALSGLLISFLLRNQGIIYAKQNKEAQEVMKEYRNQINKTKPLNKLHTIAWYMFWATIRDIFLKGLTVAVSTWFILYIFIEGSGEWGLIGLAVANIFMFAGFGLVGLATVYDKYLEEHIPVIKERIQKLKEQREQKEQKEKNDSQPMKLDNIIKS